MKKIDLFFAIAGFLALTACNKADDGVPVDENPTNEIPAAEAKTALAAMSDDMHDDVVAITQSEGVNAIEDLLGLFSGGLMEGGKVLTKQDALSLVREKAKLAAKVMVPESARQFEQDGGFNFDDAKGVFEWKPARGEFRYTKGGDAVVFKFPTEGSATNNAVFSLTAYQDIAIEDSMEVYYNPVAISANMTVDDEEVLALELEVSWKSADEPESAYLSLFLKPFTFTLDFDDSEAASSSLQASIDKGTESIVAVSANVDYTSAAKEDVKLVDGFVSYGMVKIAGDIDVEALDASEDGDPNDYVNLSLYSQDKKLGDIFFELEEIEEGVQDYVPYVKYTDGSTEKLEDLLKPVIDEAEAFFTDMEDSIG